MKLLPTLGMAVALLVSPVLESAESKTWDTSYAAKQLVHHTIVLGTLVSPYGTGWTEYEQLAPVSIVLVIVESPVMN